MDILDHRAEWEAIFKDKFAAHVAEHGETDFSLYNRADNAEQPGGKAVDLSQSRLLFVTTAGGYLKDSQEPFDAPNLIGDYTYRLFPIDTPFDAIAYAHDHYDHQFVDADPQVLLPLKHLADMVEEGKIGELAPTVFSYSGYTPDLGQVLDKLVPAVVQQAKDQNADAALLVPS